MLTSTSVPPPRSRRMTCSFAMSTEHIVAIIQARMASTRLPGKTLAPFGDSTVLNHILERLQSVKRLPELVVATTEDPEDDVIVNACKEAGIEAYRGHATDVLGRFVACIKELPSQPDLILRICADRPFLCPVLVDELLRGYDEHGHPDYLSNSLQPSYPRGLDLEIVRTDCLMDSHCESQDPYEREHVTPFVYRRLERYKVVGLICPYGNYSYADLAIETPADYKRLTALHGQLPADYDYRDLLNALELAG